MQIKVKRVSRQSEQGADAKCNAFIVIEEGTHLWVPSSL